MRNSYSPKFSVETFSNYDFGVYFSSESYFFPKTFGLKRFSVFGEVWLGRGSVWGDIRSGEKFGLERIFGLERSSAWREVPFGENFGLERSSV